ncbi:MAG: DUF4129 domain-containing protein [Gammaproteobacteria bacterium]
MTLLLRWVLLPVSLVVGLAALLRMSGPAVGRDDLTGIIRLPRPMTGAILTLFGLAAAVFFVGLLRRMRSRRRGEGEEVFVQEATPMPAWMRTLTQLLSLANFVFIAYLIWRGVIPLTELLALGQNAVGALGSAAQQPQVAAPFLVNWTFGVLALVAGLAAVALALWLGFSDRLVQWWAGTDDDAESARAVAAAEPLEDPRAESDPRRAIMRAYASFERVAAHSGVARQPWHTPMEFMRETLRRWPAPRHAVPTLTGLFELARFSRRSLGGAERANALQALDEITAATEERRTDAAR